MKTILIVCDYLSLYYNCCCCCCFYCNIFTQSPQQIKNEKKAMDATIQSAPFLFNPFPFVNSCIAETNDALSSSIVARSGSPMSTEEYRAADCLSRAMAEDVLLEEEKPQQQQYNAWAVRAALLEAPRRADDRAIEQYGQSMSAAKQQQHCVWEAHLRCLPDNFVPMRDICEWLKQNIEESDDDTQLLSIHEMWLRFCYWYSGGELSTAKNTFCTRSRFGNLVTNAVNGPHCRFRTWTSVKPTKHFSYVHGIRWSATALPTPSTSELEEQMRRLLSDRRFCLSEELVERKQEISRGIKRSPPATRRARPSSGTWR
jgi:hypothetical protein